MKRKYGVIISIVILGLLVVGQAGGLSEKQGVHPLSRGVLYVGGSGPGNHSTISEAINNASQGDTIFVYNGTYPENINIGKKIHLIGENKTITTIEGQAGSDQIIKIVSSQVHITGFTLKGASDEQDALRVFALMEEIEIYDNIFKNCGDAILLQVTTERIEVYDNQIQSATYTGIRMLESDRNRIHHNDILDCGEWGISLESVSKQNNVSENSLSSNNGGIHIAGGSADNTIQYNQVFDSDNEGILIEGLSNDNTMYGNYLRSNYVGIKISGSSRTHIEFNQFEQHDREGVLLLLSNDNMVRINNFMENRRHATLRFSFRNAWEWNYWDNWIALKLENPVFEKIPKFIIGLFRINFDMHPVAEPYNVTG